MNALNTIDNLIKLIGADDYTIQVESQQNLPKKDKVINLVTFITVVTEDLSITDDDFVLFYKTPVGSIYLSSPTCYVITVSPHKGWLLTELMIKKLLISAYDKFVELFTLLGYTKDDLLKRYNFTNQEDWDREFKDKLYQYKPQIEQAVNAQYTAVYVASQKSRPTSPEADALFSAIYGEVSEVVLPVDAGTKLGEIDTLTTIVKQLSARVNLLETRKNKLVNSVYTSVDTHTFFTNIDKSLTLINSKYSDKYKVELVRGNKYADIIIDLYDVVITCGKAELAKGSTEDRVIAKEIVKTAYWYLGKITVTLKVVNTTVQAYFDGAEHPHIMGKSLCKDPKFTPTITKCITSGAMLQLCNSLRAFLSVYNPESPYKRMRQIVPHVYDTLADALKNDKAERSAE